MLNRIWPLAMVISTIFTLTITAQAEQTNETTHTSAMHTPHKENMLMMDKRILVHFPDKLREHTLANMRDHLLTLSEIQAALANNQFDKASEIAEQHLGLSSLKLHGAHEVAQYMPKQMQQLGTTMHRSASHFALVAGNASVNGDMKPVLAALSRVTQSCVACHSSFRLQ